jgi:hypothetical protein
LLDGALPCRGIGKVIKQAVFVDSRPGAGGNIGAQAAAGGCDFSDAVD